MKYRLKKDTPNCKAGTIFRKSSNDNDIYINDDLKYSNGGLIYYDKETVENNPEWFEKVEDIGWTDRDLIDFAKHICVTMERFKERRAMMNNVINQMPKVQ